MINKLSKTMIIGAAAIVLSVAMKKYPLVAKSRYPFLAR
jgi:hypothetical protein